MPAVLPHRYTFSPISIVSISRAAPEASRIWRVAFMISGPMPSPWATVMGVFVGIAEQLGYWNAQRHASWFMKPPWGGHSACPTGDLLFQPKLDTDVREGLDGLP